MRRSRRRMRNRKRKEKRMWKSLEEKMGNEYGIQIMSKQVNMIPFSLNKTWSTLSTNTSWQRQGRNRNLYVEEIKRKSDYFIKNKIRSDKNIDCHRLTSNQTFLCVTCSRFPWWPPVWPSWLVIPYVTFRRATFKNIKISTDFETPLIIKIIRRVNWNS